MNPEEGHYGRRSLPHHAPIDYKNQSIILFVTQVVSHRRPLLARSEIVTLIESSWSKAGDWLVGYYMIMPDHIHFFCAPSTFPPTPLKRWMQFWRADVTRQWPWAGEKPIWQRDFFDRQLRAGESYTAAWQYFQANPARAGLTPDATQWPWQGEQTKLRWQEPE